MSSVKLGCRQNLGVSKMGALFERSFIDLPLGKLLENVKRALKHMERLSLTNCEW